MTATAFFSTFQLSTQFFTANMMMAMRIFEDALFGRYWASFSGGFIKTDNLDRDRACVWEMSTASCYFLCNFFFRIRHGRFTPTKFGEISPLANCKGFKNYFLANNPIPVKSRIPVKIWVLRWIRLPRFSRGRTCQNFDWTNSSWYILNFGISQMWRRKK